MQDQDKTKEELINELVESRRIANSYNRTLIEASVDPLVTISADGKITDVNSATERVTGCSRDELIGTDFSDYFTEPERAGAGYQQVFKEGLVKDYELEIRHRNGHVTPVTYSASLYCDESGEVTGVFAAARDITMRKRAEELLKRAHDHLEQRVKDRTADLQSANENLLREIKERKKAEQELQTEREILKDILEVTLAGYWDWDIPNNVIYMSPRLKEMLGYEDHELPNLPETWQSLIFQEDLPGVLEVFDQHVRSRGRIPYYNEVRYRHKDGSTVWVICAGRVIEWDREGNPIRMVGCHVDISERKRAEETIQEQLDFLNAVMESVAHPFYVIDANDYTILMANSASNLDLSLGESTCYALTHNRNEPCNSSEHICPLEPVKKTRRPVTVEHMHYDKDGQVTNIEVHAYPVLDRKGNVAQVIQYCLDITERKKAEEALRESEARYRVLIDSINDAVFVHYVNEDASPGRFIQVNEEACQRLGYTRDELLQLTPRDISESEEYERIGHRRGELLSKGKVVFETRHVGKDGRRFIVESNIRLFSYLGKRAALSVSRDITDRKKGEEALLREKTLIDSIVSNIPAGVAFLDNDFVLRWCNPGYARLIRTYTPYTPEQAVGMCYYDYAQGSQSQVEDWFREVRGMGQAQTRLGFKLVLQQDGEEKTTYWDTSVAPLTDATGTVEGILILTQDVTERRQAEEERESLRTQLLVSQKMEAVGTLAGGIAHDFNNILTIVMGFSDLLLMGKDEEDPSHADLQKINQAAQKGADLVQRLLAFSRKSEVKPRPLNLNHQIEQLQKMLTRAIPKLIEIELNLAHGLSPVNADPTQLDQVLMNLAVNAKDAMPGGGTLTFETADVFLDEEYARSHLGIKPGEYVLLSVSDSGHGMDKETMDHIFEPFYTTKEAGTGTGLGLAMVYGIVKQHGGYITCYSEPGEGTTFKMYFPVIEMEIDQDVTKSGEMPAFGTGTILLVDDEEFVRELGKRILERSGYTVLIAANGKEALDLYRREKGKISLVILDLIMPEMGGKQCLEVLLKMDPQVKILISSGVAENGQIKKAIETGARGFVGKPYNVKGMLQAVCEALDQS